MKRWDSILNELKEIAPTLAQMDKKNPFGVPTGFFQENPGATIIANTEQEVIISSQLQQLRAKQPFQLPEGFFSELSQRSIANVQITQDDLSTLRDKSDFGVPSDYFKNLSGTILNKIKNQEVDKEGIEGDLENWKKALQKNPFSVPQLYFENLPADILNKIEENELTEILGEQGNPFLLPQEYFENLSSNVLNNIHEQELREILSEKSEDFIVPQGYFEDLSSRVIEKATTSGKRAPKVVPMPQTSKPTGGRIRSIVQWVGAAAAMLAVFVIGNYLLSTSEVTPTHFNLDNALAELSPEAFDYLLETHIENEEDIMSLVGEGDFNVFTFSKINTDAALDAILDDIDDELLNDILL